LWNKIGDIDQGDSSELAIRLHEMSLLSDCNLDRRTIRLHDVVRAHLRSLAGRERLAALDGTIVDGLRDRCHGNWAALRLIPYAMTYLPSHLWGAGRTEALDALLMNWQWIIAKIECRGISETIRDYDLAGAPEGSLLGRSLLLSAPAFTQFGRD